MSMTVEQLYLRLFDEIKAREALQTRVEVLEYFVKEKFPEYFAGEVGTVADPELKPVITTDAEPLVGELPQPNTGLVPLEETNASKKTG